IDAQDQRADRPRQRRHAGPIRSARRVVRRQRRRGAAVTLLGVTQPASVALNSIHLPEGRKSQDIARLKSVLIATGHEWADTSNIPRISKPLAIQSRIRQANGLSPSRYVAGL